MTTKTSNSRLSRMGAAFLLLSVAAACGDSSKHGGSAPGAVSLGAAGGFTILAKSGISNSGPTSIVGDIGVSPIDHTAITGLPLTPATPAIDGSTVFATSVGYVTGKVYAANYGPPTPGNLIAAVGDMELAYTTAAGRAAGATELGDGEIGDLDLAAGVYKWGTGVGITTDVTLRGSATDVWIFQIAGNLTVADNAEVILAGEAKAKNIFWQVAGDVTLGTTAHLEGIVLCKNLIALNTGASVNGRLLAQAAVTLLDNDIVAP